MRLRFIILVLLALLITAGFVGAVSATDPVITSFEPNKDSVFINDNVIFTWSATNATSYLISYSKDGTGVSAESGVTHKFTSADTYVVTLTAKNNTATATKSVTITVNDPIIKTINVKVDKPIPGNTQGSGITETLGVIVESTSWSPKESNSKFDEDEEYTVTVKVKPGAGYKFSTSTTTPIAAKINSISADIDDDSKSENSLTFSYKFDATTTIINDDIYLTITEPTSGETPDKRIKSSTSHVDADNSEVTWSPSDTKFKAGEDYTATIIVPPSKDYSFESEPTVYLNDDKLSSSEVSLTTEGKLKVIHKFTNDISEVYLTIDEPSVGTKPDTEAEAKDGLVKVNNPITWDTDDTTFSAGGSYKVTINVKRKDLEYIDSPTYYINNKVAKATKKDDGSYDITCTFTTASDISKIVITLNAPVAGSSAPSTAHITSNPYNAVDGTVSWSPSVSTFASDTAYTANINVNAFSGYRFTSSVTATVNGDAAKVSRTSDSSVTVSYTYPRTAKAYTDIPTIEPTQTQTPETTSSGGDTSIPNPIGIIRELVKLFLSMFDFNNYVMAETPSAAEQ